MARDEVELFGGTEHLLGYRHEPVGPARGAVLVCSSAPADGPVDDLRLAQLGVRLARAGVAAQRFHHRGVPPSDGDPATLGFGALVDDARRALDLLRDRHPDVPVGVVAARAGALVAARVLRSAEGVPLALWEPVVDPRTLLEDAAAHVDHERGALGLFGWAFAGDLVDGTAVRGLAAEIGDAPRPVLIVQTAPGSELRPGYERLVARWREQGVVVDAAVVPCDGDVDGRTVPTGPATRLVETTATWMVARLAAAGATANGAELSVSSGDMRSG
jgi:alpha/beta superfamily hydrolase